LTAPDHIEVRGVRAMGVHGVLPEERKRPQPFEVDVDLEVDLAAAGTSDDLTDTVDYGAVAVAVAKVVTGESFRLLERLADRIAAVALEDPRVSSATVTVRKLEPPIDLDIGSVGVRITRSRS
jgi:dihydroneopterin aldolase